MDSATSQRSTVVQFLDTDQVSDQLIYHSVIRFVDSVSTFLYALQVCVDDGQHVEGLFVDESFSIVPPLCGSTWPTQNKPRRR